jgi:hypothetical protein
LCPSINGLFACPVISLFNILPGPLLHHFYPVKLFSISLGPLFQLGRSP